MINTVIVIPSYNEEKRLPIREFDEFILKDRSVKFLIVNEGSTDNTLNILKKLKNHHPDQINIQHLKKNLGKADAIRNGMLELESKREFKYVGYMDADLATPLNQINKLRDVLDRSENISFVFGSRIAKLGSNIKRNTYRHYLGRIVATLISMELKLAIYDTQCGLKLFRREILNTLFMESFKSKWLFDVELFHRLMRLNSNISLIAREIPLDTWVEKGNSKITFIDILKIPVELYRIHKNYEKF